MFEKIVLKRIENSLIEKKISFPHELQFGFRDDHGAVPACFVLKECISFYVTKGSPVFCTFLDNEKAFDRIWHNGLLYKLYELGIDPYIWSILRDWYYKSKCFVSFAGINSSLFKVSQGVGQGRVLSAFMFLVYINDLLYELCSTNNGLFLDDLHIPSILLADDTALLSTSPKSLQNMLNIVEKNAHKWRLHYNPSKSVFIVFNKSPMRVNPGVKLFNSFIPQCDHIIYAGCLLQENLKADKLIERACKNARTRIHSLYKIGLNSFQLSPVISTKIWKRVVLPSALYVQSSQAYKAEGRTTLFQILVEITGES